MKQQMAIFMEEYPRKKWQFMENHNFFRSNQPKILPCSIANPVSLPEGRSMYKRYGGKPSSENGGAPIINDAFCEGKSQSFQWMIIFWATPMTQETSIYLHDISGFFQCFYTYIVVAVCLNIICMC